MVAEIKRGCRNRLLASLSPADLALLSSCLEPLELKFRQRLESANRKIDCVYFLSGGLASVVAVSRRDRRQAEIGMIGYEGMTGLAVLHGAGQSPHDTFMQVEGRGHSIEADRLSALLRERPSIAASFLRFAHVFEVQTALTALANAEGSIEERLARWLLMSHDRLTADILKMTHEFLALMLGARRPGVTIALQRLEARGMVAAGRGMITILDRHGLEECANGLYGQPEAEFDRLFAKL